MLKSIKNIIIIITVLLLTACGGFDFSGAGDPDITAPIITVYGDDPKIVPVGVSCTDEGATAIDDRDGIITVIVSGTVDVMTVGTYTITYTATDSAGNSSTATRTVHVVPSTSDTTPPVITILGDDPITIMRRHTYSDAGATANDDTDGNITSDINTTTNIDISTLGTYMVTYQVKDMHGNLAEANRTVTVVESNISFRLRINTDHNGSSSSADDHFIVSTDPLETYNYNIDCDDDGIWDATGVTGDHNCTYAASGDYTITIEGGFPHIYFNYIGDANKTLDIQQWGEIEWHSMRSAFEGCERVMISATDDPDLSHVTDMHNMFHEAHAMNDDISDWNVSTVTNMSGIFAGASSFDQDINSWDVSSAIMMQWMFSNAQNFNRDLNSWDVRKVVNTAYMFKEAFQFNGDITDWNTSHITDMHEMFYEAFAFDRDIGNWNVSSVTNMFAMFGNAYNPNTAKFNQDLSLWNVSQVTNMGYMFTNASQFNKALDWQHKTANVTNFEAMFLDAKLFNQDIGDWNVSSATTMRSMFNSAEEFNQDIGSWDTSNVRDMSYMFSEADDFDQDIGSWNTSIVRDMNHMFCKAKNFNKDLRNWDVSTVTNMQAMFKYAETFDQDITDWNVSSVSNMSYMFCHAEDFNQSIGDWGDKTSLIGDMTSMFENATHFDQDIGGLDISSTTNMTDMLKGITLSTPNYDSLLSNWNANPHQNNVTFHGGGSTCSTACGDRSNLADGTGNNWHITDGNGTIN